MVAISFSVKKEELLNGRKRQTIRRRNPERIEQMKEHGIQVYWKQRSKEGSKLFNAELTEHFIIKFKRWKSFRPTARAYPDGIVMYIKLSEDGNWTTAPYSFMNNVAKADGFSNFEELWDCLTDLYSEQEVLNTIYDVIIFEEVKDIHSRKSQSQKCPK